MGWGRDGIRYGVNDDHCGQDLDHFDHLEYSNYDHCGQIWDPNGLLWNPRLGLLCAELGVWWIGMMWSGMGLLGWGWWNWY